MSDALRAWVAGDLRSARDRLVGGILDLVPPERMAEQVDGGGIPPVYVLWHMTRHHDVAMNSVLRSSEPVVEGFLSELGVSSDLWRGLAEGADLDLVDVLDAAAVADYARATLDHSISWLESDGAAVADLHEVPDAAAALDALGTPRDDFGWLYNMWSDKPRQWFLSWEGIGHIVTHTGELVSLRNRMGLSPF